MIQNIKNKLRKFYSQNGVNIKKNEIVVQNAGFCKKKKNIVILHLPRNKYNYAELNFRDFFSLFSRTGKFPKYFHFH